MVSYHSDAVCYVVSCHSNTVCCVSVVQTEWKKRHVCSTPSDLETLLGGGVERAGLPYCPARERGPASHCGREQEERKSVPV